MAIKKIPMKHTATVTEFDSALGQGKLVFAKKKRTVTFDLRRTPVIGSSMVWIENGTKVRATVAGDTVTEIDSDPA